MRLILSISFIFYITFLSLGQINHVSCSHDAVHGKSNIDLLPNKNLRVITSQVVVEDTSTLLKIPVVFNVVHMGEPIGVGSNVSEEQLRNAIDYLNTYYRKRYNPYSQQSTFGAEGTKGRDTKVEFYIATVDTNCAYFSGIRRINGTQFPDYVSEGIKYGNDSALKSKTGIDVNRYLNIWIVNKINSNGQGVIGYAYYPSAYGRVDGFGCVISYNNINGILPHEIGHFLGLTHNDMSIGKFTNEHSYNIIRESVNFYKTEKLTDSFACEPLHKNEGAIVSINKLPETVCEGIQNPTISLLNYGADTIQKALFKVKQNDKFLYYHYWEGNLARYDTTIVALPTLKFLKGNYTISVELVKVNNESDFVYSNNKIDQEIAVAGFVPDIPFQEQFESHNENAFIALKNERSNASIQYLREISSSSALLLEGVDTENKSYLQELPYNSYMPWSSLNKSYFANASFCFHAEKNESYILSFDRYQDNWGSSHFRVLANGKQVQQARSHRNLEWERDSVAISLGEETDVLVTLQSSCDYAYETRAKYGNGSYVAIDNIFFNKTKSASFQWNYDFLGLERGCAPLDKIPVNNSFGVPMPIEYQYLIDKGDNLYDTIIQLNTPSHFKFKEEGVFGVHIIALFEDGSQDSIYYPKIANTTKEVVYNSTLEHAEGPNNWSTIGDEQLQVFWTTSENTSSTSSASSHVLNLVNQSKVYDGLVYSMRSMPFDLSVLNHVVLHFDYAYAVASLGIAQKEYLAVKVSSDCGATWEEVYRKYGTALMTTAFDVLFYNTLYQPKKSDWKREFIDLNELSNLGEVLIQFDFHPNYGNALYLDKITVEDQTLITKLPFENDKTELSIFPNPVDEFLVINSTDEIEKVVVTDVFSQVYFVSEGKSEIDIRHLKKGVYTAQIYHDSKFDVVKFLKK